MCGWISRKPITIRFYIHSANGRHFKHVYTLWECVNVAGHVEMLFLFRLVVANWTYVFVRDINVLLYVLLVLLLYSDRLPLFGVRLRNAGICSALSLTHTCECTRALSPNHPIRTETNQKPIITQFIYENSAMDKRWGCFSKRKPTFKWVSPSDSEVICTETLR